MSWRWITFSGTPSRHLDSVGVAQLVRGEASPHAGLGRDPPLPGPSEVSSYNSTAEIHPSARKHGIADEDSEHVMRHALAIYDQDTASPGPARSADLLEVVTVVRDDGSELAIHAMKMRPSYRRLLPGADDG